jgi:uncharacterized protein YcnI
VRHRRLVPVAAVVVSALTLPALACAHVTVNPQQVPAGAYTLLDIRVPNERDSASTTKVVVKMPPGIVSASYEPVAGWDAKVAVAKLAQPVQTPDGPISEAVSTITWTATRSGGAAIAPGQFRDFPISVQIPGQAGDVLTFKALQTYSNGEIVRWIGAPDADEPAATVRVTGAAADAATPATATTATTAGGALAPAAVRPGDDGGSSDTLAIIALVVGVVAIFASFGALAAGRRRSHA